MNTLETIPSNCNETLALNVIQEAINKGVTEFCVCTGNRMRPLFTALMRDGRLTTHFWYEERSAAFFALGRSKLTGKPIAVITTSGTAAGELLPAVMEAYYSEIPLLLITADRPRRFRGTGAPQTAEQVGLFGVYTPFAVDLAGGEVCDLSKWNGRTPAHLNVCLEEPLDQAFESAAPFEMPKHYTFSNEFHPTDLSLFDEWMDKVEYPFVVVGGLAKEERGPVIDLLLKLQAPVFLEGVSGIREDLRLQKYRIHRSDKIWTAARTAGYPIDGVLRVGRIPTFRLWRDLEDLEGKIALCSVSSLPYSGLSWGGLVHTSLRYFVEQCKIARHFNDSSYCWREADIRDRKRFVDLCSEDPIAEPSLIHAISKIMPKDASVFLGNSLPIREWDLSATDEDRGYKVSASRGLNGIDGQIATFIGLSSTETDNWAILGDLTALYDMAGPWILEQLENLRVNIVIVNNGGGKIFERMVPDQRFQNPHSLSFEPLAKMWGMEYLKWLRVPDLIPSSRKNRLIEIVPDNISTKRFWEKYLN